MVFLFITGYVNRISGYENDLSLLNISSLYFKPVDDVCSDRRMSEVHDELIIWLTGTSQDFMTKTVVLRRDPCESQQFPIEIHLLNPLCDDLGKHGNISSLDAAHYDQLNAFHEETRQKIINKKSNQNGMYFGGNGASLEKSKGRQKGQKAHVPSADNVRQIQAPDGGCLDFFNGLTPHKL